MINKLAFDIGANAGDMTQILLDKGYEVVAFEPNPNLFSSLLRRFRDMPVHVDRRGLSYKEGKETFMISDGSGLSTYSQDWVNKSRFAETNFWDIKIDTIVTTIDQAIQDYGTPDYIKIDVEGYEFYVLLGLTQLLPNTLICFEWTEEMPSTIDSCIRYIRSVEYNAFARVDNDGIEFKENLKWMTYDELLTSMSDINPERKEKWGMIYFMKDLPEVIVEPDCFTDTPIYASYVNLDSRPDRNEHMVTELARIGISASRIRGLLPNEVNEPEDKLWTMKQRTIGAIGCWYSQVSIMQKALELGEHSLVMEDDLIFCDDFTERLEHIKKFLATREWDIFWFGGTYHLEPTWHKSENGVHTHPDMQMCQCNLNKDWEPTEDPNIVRTYGCWATYAYLVNKNSLEKVLSRLDNNVYRSQGIDHCMIMLQPELNTFAFNPGCIKQMDSVSNIGNGITYFSGFASLGPQWFKEKL